MLNYQVGEYLLDTLTPDSSRLLALALSEEFANQDVLRSLSSEALADDDITSYNFFANQIISENTCEDDWEIIAGLLATLQVQNRTVFELTTTEIATVQSIADQDFKCLATSNARAILKQVLRIEYPIEFNINSVRSASSVPNQESFTKPDVLLGV
ncbi:MAG: hypothetical protein ACI9J3_001387 [Parvicellaceae bacterium]